MHIDTVIVNIKNKKMDYIEELLRDDDTLNELFAKDPATARILVNMAMHTMRPIDAQRMRAFIMTYQRQHLHEISKRNTLVPVGKPVFPPRSMYKPFVPASPKTEPEAHSIPIPKAKKPSKPRPKRGAPCGEGRERNPKTNRCRKSRPKKPCKEGQVRNPKTGRCKKI